MRIRPLPRRTSSRKSQHGSAILIILTIIGIGAAFLLVSALNKANQQIGARQDDYGCAGTGEGGADRLCGHLPRHASRQSRQYGIRLSALPRHNQRRPVRAKLWSNRLFSHRPSAVEHPGPARLARQRRRMPVASPFPGAARTAPRPQPSTGTPRGNSLSRMRAAPPWLAPLPTNVH